MISITSSHVEKRDSRIPSKICLDLNLAIKFYKSKKPTRLNYIITLFFRNETSLVSLKFLENGKRIQEVVYSHPYTLRAEISRHDGKIH